MFLFPAPWRGGGGVRREERWGLLGVSGILLARRAEEASYSWLSSFGDWRLRGDWEAGVGSGRGPGRAGPPAPAPPKVPQTALGQLLDSALILLMAPRCLWHALQGPHY